MSSKTSDNKLSELVEDINSEINNKGPDKNNVSIADINNVSDSLSSTINFSSGEETWFQKNLVSIILGTLLFFLLIGVNIFLYLSQGTGELYDNLRPYIVDIIGIFGYTVSETTKNVVDTSAIGSKGVVDTAAKSITTSAKGTDKLLETSLNEKRSRGNNQVTVSDSSTSKIQRQKSNVKGGWCFIGEDKGIRTCAKVNDSNLCLSNKVFETEETCEYVGMTP
jgi:hypothetical protein